MPPIALIFYEVKHGGRHRQRAPLYHILLMYQHRDKISLFYRAYICYRSLIIQANISQVTFIVMPHMVIIIKYIDV